ncbi:MAG: cytochrome c3 family protein [Vicinamibacterales bacterium]
MSQIFSRSANALARFTLAGALGLALIAGGVVYSLMYSSWATKQNEFVEQPLQFSHAHHVGGEGIDCRYCHTSVEKSAFAGIPPTKTCMNCHSQIWTNAPILEPVRASLRDNKNLTWTRVNDLPDFVYFNHKIHVRQGVGCVTCHGQVDRMPLMVQAAPLLMGWCLDCHRAPEKYLRPRDAVFAMDYQVPTEDHPVAVTASNGTPHTFRNQLELGQFLKAEYSVTSPGHLTSCSVCHR